MILRYEKGDVWIHVESRDRRSPRGVAIYTSLQLDKELAPDMTKRELDVYNATVDGITSALMATMSRSDDLWEKEKFDEVCRTLVDALSNNA